MEIVYPEHDESQEEDAQGPAQNLVPLTEEEEVELLASLFFSREEIMLIMYGAPDPFTKGRLKAEAELRKSIFAMAKAGSTPAQNMALEIIEMQKMREV